MSICQVIIRSLTTLSFCQVFSSRLVLFPLNSLYIFNILSLILGPILLIGLMFVQAVIQAANRCPQEDRLAPGSSLLTRVFTDFHLMWRWSKFWVAIIITIGIQAFLVFTFITANPYVRLRWSHFSPANDRLRSFILIHTSSFSVSPPSVSLRSHGRSHPIFHFPHTMILPNPRPKTKKKPSFSNHISCLGFFCSFPL